MVMLGLVWLVLGLGGTPLVSPILVSTLSVSGVFQVGFGTLRTTLPTAQRRSGSSFCHVNGYQGAEEDSDKLQLTDRLLQAVLAEAQVVCIGQPMLIAGDLNADPAVIPCLAKGISARQYVDLASLRILSELVLLLMLLVVLVGRRALVCVLTFLWVPWCSTLLLRLASVTDRWFTPHFSVLARAFVIGSLGRLMSACPNCMSQPLWPACWIGYS